MSFRAKTKAFCAFLFAGALLAASFSAQAKVTAPNVVPAKAANIVSVPDLAALQKAWQGSSLRSVAEQIMQVGGAHEALNVVQSFLPQIEKELGFTLDGATVASMIEGMDLFMNAPSGEGAPVVGGVLKIGDKDKFERFLTYWERAAIKAAQEAASDEATSDTQQRDFITSEVIQGVTAKHFVTAKGVDVYYAQVAQLFLIASQKETLAGMISRAAGKDDKGGLDKAADFDKVEKALAAQPGVVYFYQNSEAALAAVQPNEQLRKLSKLMRELTPFSMSGSSLQIEAKKLRTYKYAPFAAGTENLLLRKLVERSASTGKLDVLEFAPQQTMLTGVTNAFDAFFLYDILRELTESLSGGAKEVDLDKQLKEAEPLLGFSVKDDLLPAMGKQMGLFVNTVDFSTGMVSVDAALACEVRDKDKMQKVLTAVERMITDKAKQMTSPLSGQQGQAPSVQISFKTAKEGDNTIRYLEIPPLPTITPGYAFVGEYLIIGASKESIQKLIAVKTGKEKGLVGSAALDQLGDVKPKGLSFVYLNFAAICDTVEAALAKGAPNEDMKKVMDALRTIKAAGGYGTVENGALVGEGVLVLE